MIILCSYHFQKKYLEFKFSLVYIIRHKRLDFMVLYIGLVWGLGCRSLRFEFR